VRYELPPGLTAEEERAIGASIDAYFGYGNVRPEAWRLVARAEGLGLGALQIRNQSLRPWVEPMHAPYTRRGTDTRMGRGDAK
jgi:hypothetical protein